LRDPRPGCLLAVGTALSRRRLIGGDPQALGDGFKLSILLDQRTQFTHPRGHAIFEATEVIKDGHAAHSG
jgi:hypothetical protein